MPCICYGAVSGQEEFDRFLKSPEGQKCLSSLKEVAAEINKFRVVIECEPTNFRYTWIKCFDHLLYGCDEQYVEEKRIP